MPHDDKDSETAILADLIHETVMPPYEYQKPQNGFGSASADRPAAKGETSEESPTTADEK